MYCAQTFYVSDITLAVSIQLGGDMLKTLAFRWMDVEYVVGEAYNFDALCQCAH